VKSSLQSSLLLRCTVFDSAGNPSVVSGTFKKAELCTEHNLEYRDLRAIDSRIPNLVPTILARRGAFLVNMLHIRALVKCDEVLLFDVYGSADTQLQSSFIYNLEHNLRLAHIHRKSASSRSPTQTASKDTPSQPAAASEQGITELPYEFRALETILASVLDALRSELGNLQGMVYEMLESLDRDIEREKLRMLLQLRRKVNGLLSRSRAVKAAVLEIL
jgi:magnesium transporter